MTHKAILIKPADNTTQINSVTLCPTCGSECIVEGGITHHYRPIKDKPVESEDDLWDELDNIYNQSTFAELKQKYTLKRK